MLRLTKQADYAVVLLTQMATEEEGLSHSARDLAQQVHLPLPIVSKILKILTREGLTLSHRGVHGGYALARPAHEISVTDVISAIDGPIAMTECTNHSDPSCGIEDGCVSRSHWILINRAICETLNGISLEEMSRPLEQDALTPTVEISQISCHPKATGA